MQGADVLGNVTQKYIMETNTRKVSTVDVPPEIERASERLPTKQKDNFPNGIPYETEAENPMQGLSTQGPSPEFDVTEDQSPSHIGEFVKMQQEVRMRIKNLDDAFEQIKSTHPTPQPKIP